MTRVYVQYNGGSGIDARYIGTVNATPNTVARHLQNIEKVSTVKVYGDEVIVFGSK